MPHSMNHKAVLRRRRNACAIGTGVIGASWAVLSTLTGRAS